MTAMQLLQYNFSISSKQHWELTSNYQYNQYQTIKTSNLFCDPGCHDIENVKLTPYTNTSIHICHRFLCKKLFINLIWFSFNWWCFATTAALALSALRGPPSTVCLARPVWDLHSPLRSDSCMQRERFTGSEDDKMTCRLALKNTKEDDN